MKNLAIFLLFPREEFLPISFKICTVITEPGRDKKELSEIFLINWQCSNIMQYLNTEYWNKCRGCVFGPPHSKKACVVVYNQYNCNRSFKAAYHTHVGVRMYIVQYTRERIRRSGRRLLKEECRHLLLPLHKNIYLKKIWRMCQIGNCTFSNLKN